MVHNGGATWNWIRGAGTIYSSLRIRRSKHCEPEDAQMSYLSMNNKDEGYLEADVIVCLTRSTKDLFSLLLQRDHVMILIAGSTDLAINCLNEHILVPLLSHLAHTDVYQFALINCFTE